ncbi:hypothetical protein Q4I28_008312 [Leishmania naiffi]|uniref:Uncharacterized protein n=1 Tax=Leishmania naiffi TaxID=5678 RepID=A0AAW3B4S2_9TRYP
MAFRRGTASINRTLVSIILLLSLPLLLDLTRLPDSSAAQEYVYSLLTPCDGLRLCNLCGEVLDMVDLAQRAVANPFQDKLTLSPEGVDLHGLQLYQRCLREPFLRGCDTLVHKVKAQKMESAKVVLAKVVEDVRFRQRWGSLGRDYILDNTVQLTAYMFDSQDRPLGGMRDLRKKEDSTENIVYQPTTLSLGGDPENESLVTWVWFLRRDVQPRHRDFCYSFCEGKLTLFGRVQLELVRFYVRHAVKSRLLLLRQKHRGTLLVAELIMISFVFCVERMMRPGLTGSDTVARRITRVQGKSAASTSTNSSLVSEAHSEDGAVAAGSGSSSGKFQCRSGGRRRRWVVVA